MKSLIATAAFVAVMIAVPAAAQTQPSDIGKREYTENCATCHGTTGKGNGPTAAWMTQKVADLTTIAKRNNGIFPFARVYEIIDGTQETKGHGTRAMPVWGTEYTYQAGRLMSFYATREATESFVQGRIVALIGYIYSLQEQ